MLIAAFIGYLVVLVVLARVLSTRMTGLFDFFMAGRTLPTVAIALTFVASWFGAGSTIGTMNQACATGISACWLIAIPTLVTCTLVALFFAKKVRNLPHLSQPEAIEHQYGPWGSLLMSLTILATCTTLIASQLVAASGLLQMTMGLTPVVAVTAILLAVITYSVIGGFRAVVMTDVMQFICFTLGILILFGFTLMTPPTASWMVLAPLGFWNVWQNLPENAAMMLTFTMAWCIAPEMWQRMASSRTAESAQKSAMIAGLILAGLYALVIATGMMATHNVALSDPKAQQNVLVTLAMGLPSPVLTAMVLVGVLSAITSTIDSSLNVSSLTVTRNIVNRYFWPSASHHQLVRMGQVATAVISIPAALIALHYQDLLKTLWLSADIYASTMLIPILGVFYRPRSGRLAGVLAMCFGAVPVILNVCHDFNGLALGPNWPGYPYTTMLGVGMSVLGFLIGEAFGPKSPVIEEVVETAELLETL